MEFLLADEANDEADEIKRTEQDPPPGALPDRVAKLQAGRAYHIYRIAEFLKRHCRLSEDAKKGLAHRMGRALWIAKPYGTMGTGDTTTLIDRIAGE